VKPTIWTRLDTLSRQWTPFGLSLLATLIAAVPLHLPAFQDVSPNWPIMAVFFWSLYRPDLLPAAAVFAVGVVYDALCCSPIGVYTAVFVLFHVAVTAQRRFLGGKPFAIVWISFAVFAAAAMILAWFIASVWHVVLLPGNALAFQYLVTIGCFPLLASAFYAWQRLLLTQV